MKKNLMFFLLLFLIGNISGTVSADLINISLQEIKDANDDFEEPQKGTRVPPSPIQCIVDTDTRIITFIPIIEDIISYEIWDESKNQLIGVYYDEEELIDAIQIIKTSALLIINTGTTLYQGYI